MTYDERKALEAIQLSYFDICDLLNGNTYTELGYDNRKDFLLILRDRMAEVEHRLFTKEQRLHEEEV
jgi:hypothetical protein